MDRERLKDVHQTDLMEGRVNQDFLDWMKTRGTTWLLVVVVVLFAYAAWVRWTHHQENYQSEAWVELSKAALPSSYEDVADRYADVGSVAHLARLRGARQLLNAVQAGQTLGAETETRTPLDESTRTEYLDKADRIYSKIVDSDDGSNALSLIVSNALLGKAAVAESRGETDRVKELFTQAAQRCEALFPQRAEQIRARLTTADVQSNDVTLMTRDELLAIEQKQKTPVMPDPLWSEPWVTELLTPTP